MRNVKRRWSALALLVLVAGVVSPVAGAQEAGERTDGGQEQEQRQRPDPSAPLEREDARREAAADRDSGRRPGRAIERNLTMRGHGERLVSNATTDVWAHDGYAYLGTFSDPCGTGEGFGEGRLVDDREGPGVPVFDVSNRHDPVYVGSVPSVEGSRVNDVKVEAMNSGDVLVHSNEACDAGRGGFEVYRVDDPENPEHLASVQVDDANPTVREVFGVRDVGVHNLFLFTQGDRDYVAVQAEGFFGGFQIFDLTDPADPQPVSAWGAELLCEPDFCSDDPYNETDVETLLAHINGYLFCLLEPCFGVSQHRLLHDITVSADGTKAYLSHWDAGLILLDISDPSDPRFVSQALAPDAGDGEVNSHAAWPSEDGSVVVETEEDFAPFELAFRITEGPNAGEYEATQGVFTTPISELPDRTMAGPTTYLGLACDADGLPEADGDGEIALIQRGECRFDTKATSAIEAGYDGMVIFNSPGNESLVIMSGEPRDIPGVSVGHSTGLAILDADSAEDPEVGDAGAAVEAVAEPEQWGNVRVWDYSDPENPRLASEFDTTCSLNPADESCDPRGTYTVHNPIVERGKAYLSWYSDGVLVLDVSDPDNPTEVGRWHRAGEDWEDSNGGIQNVWGIFKERGKPWIYASDRNGGLYTLQELGSGSEERPGHP